MHKSLSLTLLAGLLLLTACGPRPAVRPGPAEALPETGKLTIKSKEAKGKVEISVADTGEGIPKETLDKLFLPLFTTKSKGMGLGLAICKRIVEAHGGDISVESAVGKGTMFTITLLREPMLDGGEKL